MISLRGLFAAIAAPETKMSKRGGMSMLGCGAMRIPTKEGDELDQERFNAQVKLMLDGGLNLFDTAPVYSRGGSEQCLGTALAASGYRRDQYFLSSKLSNFASSQWSAEKSKEMFEQSLKRLRTDYFDIYMLHSVAGDSFDDRFLKNGMLDWLFEQKRLGRIRRIGFSIHGDFPRFEWLMKQHDEGRYRWDVALIQCNYVDWHHASQVNKQNVDAERYYRELESRGIGMLVMEPILGGRLANPPEPVLKELRTVDPEATPVTLAFRFCVSHPGVLAVLSGMGFETHMRENIATFSPIEPLTKAQLVAMERAAAEFVGCGSIPCTRCNYCMPCPYGLDIPSAFQFLNDVRQRQMTDRREIRALYERLIPDPRRRPDRCIGCGRCEPHCPQYIEIPKMLDSVAAFLEEYA